MKTLVVYYSFEGNTRLVANNISQELGCDLGEIKLIKEPSSKGFMKYLWGGSQVMMKKIPEIEPLDFDVDNYDLIFIGTPIWAWTYSPPIRSFLEKVTIKDKDIAIFTTNEGQNGKTFQHFEKDLKDNRIVGQVQVFAPLKKEKEKSLIAVRAWAKGIYETLKTKG